MPPTAATPRDNPPSAPDRLRALLAGESCLSMPCCFDALSARLIEQAGFPLTFMSGFAVSATRLALPDTGLITVSEMLDQGRAICQAVSIPVIGDGDTGHGNPVNVRRTVEQFGRAGFAGVMIEDQVAPKRCGHTGVKAVVDRAEALARIRAAVEARNAGADLLILARTDTRGTLGLDEAIWRLRAFADLGADILFLEAPRDEAEMARGCREVPGVHMANLLAGGLTPILPPARLAELGYRLAAYPLALLAVAVAAMRAALGEMAAGQMPPGIKWILPRFARWSALTPTTGCWTPTRRPALPPRRPRDPPVETINSHQAIDYKSIQSAPPPRLKHDPARFPAERPTRRHHRTARDAVSFPASSHR